MPPEPNPQTTINKSQPVQQQSDSKQKAEHDDRYAEALAKMAALDMQMEEKAKPEQKHFISKKILVYIVASLVISIATLIIGHFVTRNHTEQQDSQTINQLLETTKDVRDLENQ